MLIELVCKYLIEDTTKDFTKEIVVNVGFKGLEEPILEDDYLVNFKDDIFILNDRIVYFNTTNTSSTNIYNYKGFQIENMNGNYQISIFESIYPCTNIRYESDHIIFEHTDINNNHLDNINNNINISNNEFSRYVLNTDKGKIEITKEYLTLTNRSNRNDYDNTNLSNNTNRNNNSDTINNDNNINNSNNRNNNNININISNNNNNIDNINIKTVIYEHFNKKEYSNLIIEYLKELNQSKFNFTKFCLIQSVDTFYLSIFKIQNQITAILSRELYNFIPILKNDFKFLLNIPYFNCNIRKIDLIPFKIPNFDLYNQYNLILNYSCVKLEENKYSFWFLIKIKEILFPLKIPGLILSPLISKMEYLLEGPYSFIISSKKDIKSSRLIFNCSTPSFSTFKYFYNSIDINNLLIKKYKLVLKCTNFDKIFPSPLLIEQYFMNEPKRITGECNINICNKSIEFRRTNYLNLRDSVSLWLMVYKEKVDLEKLIKKRWINLEYLIRRGSIEKDLTIIKRILKSSIKSDNDKNRYDKISNNKKDISKSNKSNIKSDRSNRSNKSNIFGRSNKISKSHRNNIKNNRKFYKFYTKTRKSYNFNNFNILQSVGHQSFLKLNSEILKGNVKILIPKKRTFSTIFEFKGNVYKLMKIEDILMCIESDYLEDRIIGSILVYFNYYDLSL